MSRRASLSAPAHNKESLEKLVKEKMKPDEKGRLCLDLSKQHLSKENLRDLMLILKDYHEDHPDNPLFELNLSGNNFNGCADNLTEVVLRGAKNLIRLNVSSCGMSVTGYTILLNQLCGSKVAALNISGNAAIETVNQSKDLLEALGANTQMTVLALPSRSQEDCKKDAEKICEANNKKLLEKVPPTKTKASDAEQTGKRSRMESKSFS